MSKTFVSNHLHHFHTTVVKRCGEMANWIEVTKIRVIIIHADLASGNLFIYWDRLRRSLKFHLNQSQFGMCQPFKLWWSCRRAAINLFHKRFACDSPTAIQWRRVWPLSEHTTGERHRILSYPVVIRLFWRCVQSQFHMPDVCCVCASVCAYVCVQITRYVLRFPSLMSLRGMEMCDY